jgi:hypothetical protein
MTRTWGASLGGLSVKDCDEPEERVCDVVRHGAVPGLSAEAATHLGKV